MFASPILGGMLFASSLGGRSRAIGVIGVLPGVLYGITYLGRSPMLASIFFWAAGFFSMRIYQKQGRVPLLTPKYLAVAGGLSVFVVVVGTTIAAFRGAAWDMPLVERLIAFPEIVRSADAEKEWAGFRHGVFSHPYAFSVYLRRALASPPEPHYGALTLGGPLELIGQHVRVPYEQFEVEPGVWSNVYSAFMPPIEDFGLAGSFFSFLAAGLLAGFGFRWMMAGRFGGAPLLTMFYPHVMVVGGYFFAYNCLVLAHAFVGLYLLWAVKRVSRQDNSGLAASPQSPLTSPTFGGGEAVGS
jgi:hypothetical protein